MTHDEELLHKRLKRLHQKAENGIVVFKSYKAMCETLKLPVKTSNSKEAQLKYLNFFCDVEKSEKGNSYIMTKVYPNPDDKVLQDHLIVRNLERILLFNFYKSNKKKLLWTNIQAWDAFGFINHRYGNLNDEKEFLNSENIGEYHLHHLKARCRRRFEDVMFSALDKLEQRRLIYYHKVYIIEDMEHEKRTAYFMEIERILTYERKALKHFKCKNIQEVWAKGLNKKFYGYLQKDYQDKEDWFNVLRGVEIIMADKSCIYEGIEEDIMELEKDNVNQNIVDLINQNADRKIENYGYRILEEYNKFAVALPLEQMKPRLREYKKNGTLMEDDYLINQYKLTDRYVKRDSVENKNLE